MELITVLERSEYTLWGSSLAVLACIKSATSSLDCHLCLKLSAIAGFAGKVRALLLRNIAPAAVLQAIHGVIPHGA